MHRLFFAAALAGMSAPLIASDEAPFDPSSEHFADAAACKARLLQIATEARAREHVAVNGPYEVAPGDVRAHAVLISGSGHRITEHRCLGSQLGSRTWRRSMDQAEAEEAETIESMAAKAEWLKKPPSD
jgi:hypothetical protein